MKNIISTITLLLVFSSLSLFAQWEGAGTEENPFKIYSVEDLNLINTNELNFNSYSDIHFELMNNIDDTLYTKLGDEFYGYFHGKGHYITLGFNDTIPSNNMLFRNIYGTIDSLTVEGKVENFRSIIGIVKHSGRLLNVISNLEIKPFIRVQPNSGNNVSVFTIGNAGVMENCINNSDLIFDHLFDYSNTLLIGVFTSGTSNRGYMINCVNNGNIVIYANSNLSVFCSIYYYANFGTIHGCINNGNIDFVGVPNTTAVSGVLENRGHIQNCINTGNFDARKTSATGAFATFNYNTVRNCLNTGVLNGSLVTGSIVGICKAANLGVDTNQVVVKNCLNTNYAYGDDKVGGIVGEIRKNNLNMSITIKNNISLSKTSMYSILGDTLTQFENYPNLFFENNFYDKQIVTQTPTIIGDVEGKAEGLLTTEMTGFALQSVLGDGWSYAEGRYPIPLGLENDSISLLAATPIYLKFTDQQNYNTVDSVSANFTVGLENNVSWDVQEEKVLVDGEDAILQDVGKDTLRVSIGNHSKIFPIFITDFTAYSLTVLANPTHGGEVHGSGSYFENEEVTLTATANDGFVFSHWSEGENTLSSNPTYSFLMPNHNLTIVANFDEESSIYNDQKLDKTPHIYPNPANNKITISSLNNREIEIFNIIGQKVENYTLHDNILDVSALKNGVYYLRIENIVLKFVKN
jgi:hypothetical protein